MRRKRKMIIIFILVLAVCGLSVGLATFSSVLTISSSATVKPNNDEYNLMIYGLDASTKVEEINSFDELLLNYGSTTEAIPQISGGKVLAPAAKIDNNMFKISDISVQFFINSLAELSSSDGALYMFAIVNEGAYPVYFDIMKLDDYLNSSHGKICVSDDPSVQEELDLYCEYIDDFVTYGHYVYESDNFQFDFFNETDLTGSGLLEIDVGEHVVLWVGIMGKSGSELDIKGEFSVFFDDISLDFSINDEKLEQLFRRWLICEETEKR